MNCNEMTSANDSILTPTEHGLSLDLGRGALRVDPTPALDLCPFTIEMRVLPRAKSAWLLVNRTPDFSRSWALTVGQDGDLAAYLSTEGGKWLWTGHTILDGQWHDIAMTFDGVQPELFVDGERCTLFQSNPKQGQKLHLPEGKWVLL